MTEEKICGIYCIENVVNRKKYIGLSADINQRWKQHKVDLNGGYHINSHLQTSWNKYGEDKFSWYILEECDLQLLQDREKFYINKYKSYSNKYGYNMTKGGDGILDLREESRTRIKNALSKHPVIQLSLDGKYISEYINSYEASRQILGHKEGHEIIRRCCENQYLSAYGYIWVYKENYNPSKKYMYDNTNGVKQEVVQLDGNLNFINLYSSIVDASLSVFGSKNQAGNISQCINKSNNKHSCGGYIWLKKSEYDEYGTKYVEPLPLNKPIGQYDKEMNFIRKFNSSKEASEFLGNKNKYFIESCCKGNYKFAYGFIWKYL